MFYIVYLREMRGLQVQRRFSKR